MNDLDVPGLLVDAQSLFVVKRGADSPFIEIVRSEATWEHIALIRDLLLSGPPISFEEWKRIPAATVSTRAEVAQIIVEPLERFLFSEWEFTRVPHVLQPGYQAPSGRVDYVVSWHDLPPLAAIQVAHMVDPVVEDRWTDSESFRRLLAHMSHLDVPGLLIDAEVIVVVLPGSETPSGVIQRDSATIEDLIAIRQIIDLSWETKNAEHAPSGQGRLALSAWPNWWAMPAKSNVRPARRVPHRG